MMTDVRSFPVTPLSDPESQPAGSHSVEATVQSKNLCCVSYLFIRLILFSVSVTLKSNGGSKNCTLH